MHNILSQQNKTNILIAITNQNHGHQFSVLYTFQSLCKIQTHKCRLSEGGKKADISMVVHAPVLLLYLETGTNLLIQAKNTPSTSINNKEFIPYSQMALHKRWGQLRFLNSQTFLCAILFVAFDSSQGMMALGPFGPSKRSPNMPFFLLFNFFFFFNFTMS